VVERSGSASEIELIPYEEAYASGFEDMRRRVPDTTKIRGLTGWTPERSLDQIIDDAIADARAEAERRAVIDLTSDVDSHNLAGRLR
jgi:UDP-glucose 4-epimerase